MLPWTPSHLHPFPPTPRTTQRHAGHAPSALACVCRGSQAPGTGAKGPGGTGPRHTEANICTAVYGRQGQREGVRRQVWSRILGGHLHHGLCPGEHMSDMSSKDKEGLEGSWAVPSGPRVQRLTGLKVPPRRTVRVRRSREGERRAG